MEKRLQNVLGYIDKNVCSKARKDAINSMIHDASAAAIDTWGIDTEDVFEYGCTDVLIRLQRNTLALANTLKIVRDIVEAIDQETAQIFVKQTLANKEDNERKAAAIERDKEYQRNRENYDRKKAKRVAEEPAE